jgi:hypothetical protein
MDNRRTGEHPLPRIAPIPRKVPQLTTAARPTSLCRRAPGLCRGLARVKTRTATALSRGLTVMPVLELLGIGLLVLLLGR